MCEEKTITRIHRRRAAWQHQVREEGRCRAPEWVRAEAETEGQVMKRTPLKRIGKKGREWNAVRAELKVECVRLGITRCEIRKVGCQGGSFLTFAHSRKRRNITTPEQLREACLCCVTCHNEIELLLENEMGNLVRQALKNR